MTEAEWLAATDPAAMLGFLGGTADRKARLFAVACCRRRWKYFADGRCRDAVAAAERFADDPDAVGDLDRAGWDTRRAVNEWRAEQGGRGVLVRVSSAALAIARRRWLDAARVAAEVAAVPVASARGRAAEGVNQSRLVRDVFGNPFRPATVDPAWQTSTVVTLARVMYESRDFSPMPILADALQDAGCENADGLDHCRDPSPHVRGCWVVDLLLGKT